MLLIGLTRCFEFGTLSPQLEHANGTSSCKYLVESKELTVRADGSRLAQEHLNVLWANMSRLKLQ